MFTRGYPAIGERMVVEEGKRVRICQDMSGYEHNGHTRTKKLIENMLVSTMNSGETSNIGLVS